MAACAARQAEPQGPSTVSQVLQKADLACDVLGELTELVMISPRSILESLERLAQSAVPWAIAWHLVLAGVLLALLLGWRPSQRSAGLLLATPVAAVALTAWWFGNPFNSSVLGVGAGALALLSLRLPVLPLRPPSSSRLLLGSALLAFGWFYPHFLEGAPRLAHLYSAPLGILPCPTLSAVIGLALLAGGFGSRLWSSTLAGLGLFYGVFGVLVLGVLIDGLLTLGALVLLGVVWSRPAWSAAQSAHGSRKDRASPASRS